MLGTVLTIVFAVLVTVVIAMAVLDVTMATADDFDKTGEPLYPVLAVAAMVGAMAILVGLLAVFILA